MTPERRPSSLGWRFFVWAMEEQKQEQKVEEGAPVSFEAWLAQQDEQTRALLDEHVRGLKSALESERQRARELQRQLREAAKLAEEGTQLRAQIDEMSRRVSETETQARFYDEAHAAGVSNLRLAYLAAREAQLINKRGETDWSRLRQLYPELFSRRSSVVAGAGMSGEGREA